MDLLNQFTQWLYDILLYIPKKVWQWLLEGLANLLNSIPLPGFVADIPAIFSAIPAEMTWFLEPFNFGPGLLMIGAAYTLRFLIRRLPVIG
jgi:hypothetical protein